MKRVIKIGGSLLKPVHSLRDFLWQVNETAHTLQRRWWDQNDP